MDTKRIMLCAQRSFIIMDDCDKPMKLVKFLLLIFEKLESNLRSTYNLTSKINTFHCLF